jgi:hypothetical protein
LKKTLALALCLATLPAYAHPGHADGSGDGFMHALLGHGHLLGIGMALGAAGLGLFAGVVWARRRQLDRRGERGMQP